MERDDRGWLEELDVRLKTLLPAEYQHSYEDVQPLSMRSAGLKYGSDGTVAWDKIWGSFCDLAMAGGPPHKGALLEPGVEADINAQFARYDEVAEEICRGIGLVSGLRAYVSPTPGWVRVTCQSDGMAEWLRRAITMENVAARRSGGTLDLPAAPHFRLEKEIKNVVTVTAKTCHYWTGHLPRAQQHAIAALFVQIARETPLIEPDSSPSRPRAARLAAAIAGTIHGETGLVRSNHEYEGWLGLQCPGVRRAVWMMRALVASNVLARREGTVLFVPINPSTDGKGSIVTTVVGRMHRLAGVRGIL
jgi:sirohydrochlorin cobaltochelatase